MKLEDTGRITQINNENSKNINGCGIETKPNSKSLDIILDWNEVRCLCKMATHIYIVVVLIYWEV